MWAFPEVASNQHRSFFQIVVLHAGTNNVSNTAEEVAEGISEIVNAIRQKLPDAYIVLPVGDVLLLTRSLQISPPLANSLIADAATSRTTAESIAREKQSSEQISIRTIDRNEKSANRSNRQRLSANGWHHKPSRHVRLFEFDKYRLQKGLWTNIRSSLANSKWKRTRKRSHTIWIAD